MQIIVGYNDGKWQCNLLIDKADFNMDPECALNC